MFLTKTRDLIPGFAEETRQMPSFRGNLVGPRVDFRRVAPSRLLEPTFAYKRAMVGQNEAVFDFRLGFLCFSVG